MTRCGRPEFRAAARIWPSRVRFPKRSEALLRLIRELAPPARMSISQCPTFASAVLSRGCAFKALFERNLRRGGVSRQKKISPAALFVQVNPSVGDHKDEGRLLVDRGENLLLSKLVPRIKRTNRLADGLSENRLVLTNSMENKVMRTTWFKVVFLGCLLASLPAYAQRPAIFYVADPTALNAADQAAFDRLTALGFSVTAIDDNLSDPADATGQQLIVISSTVTSGNIGTKHTATAVPILNWEPALFDELGIQANNANGVTIAGTQIEIVDASHPLAGGLPAGVMVFFNAAGGLASPDTPVASVNIVAREVGGTRPVIVGVEKGAALNPARIAAAPERRVCFPLDNDSFARLTADGLTLFDAAINWAAGPTNAPVGVAQSPTNLTVIENQSAAFSVIVTGAPPWSFQWQRSAGAGVFTNIPGAASRTFTFSPVKLTDDSASFRVQVANAFGNATSGA